MILTEEKLHNQLCYLSGKHFNYPDPIEFDTTDGSIFKVYVVEEEKGDCFVCTKNLCQNDMGAILQTTIQSYSDALETLRSEVGDTLYISKIEVSNFKSPEPENPVVLVQCVVNYMCKEPKEE